MEQNKENFEEIKKRLDVVIALLLNESAKKKTEMAKIWTNKRLLYGPCFDFNQVRYNNMAIPQQNNKTLVTLAESREPLRIQRVIDNKIKSI